MKYQRYLKYMIGYVWTNREPRSTSKPNVMVQDNVNCQRCWSSRVITFLGACGEDSHVFLGDTEAHGSIPKWMNFGEGSEVTFRVCSQCGQMQGTWPCREEENVVAPPDAHPATPPRNIYQVNMGRAALGDYTRVRFPIATPRLDAAARGLVREMAATAQMATPDVVTPDSSDDESDHFDFPDDFNENDDDDDMPELVGDFNAGTPVDTGIEKDPAGYFIVKNTIAHPEAETQIAPPANMPQVVIPALTKLPPDQITVPIPRVKIPGVSSPTITRMAAAPAPSPTRDGMTIATPQIKVVALAPVPALPQVIKPIAPVVPAPPQVTNPITPVIPQVTIPKIPAMATQTIAVPRIYPDHTQTITVPRIPPVPTQTIPPIINTFPNIPMIPGMVPTPK